MNLPSFDNAVAVAQDVTAQAEAAEQTPANSEDAAAAAAQPGFELMPQADAAEQSAITFTSEAVVQPTPEGDEEDGTAEQSSAASLAALVDEFSDTDELTEQMQCLAGAVYFESRGETLNGQLAVAEVVINRAQDRRWPDSYCGVVYQRAQFSFVRGGRMPRIRTSTAAWARAKAVATIAHDGLWQTDANEAVYFHATRVKPRWSKRKTRVAQIDKHIFYR